MRKESKRGVFKVLSVLGLGVLLATWFALGMTAESPAKVVGGYDSQVIRCRDNDAGRIALTFDDGPHPKYTEEILDILAEYNVKATFFVIGENVAAYPELVEREMAEGHEIGNHTQTHPIGSSSEEKLEKEVLLCESAIDEVLDRRPYLFRPPGGVLNETIMGIARRHHYDVVLWSIDTRDWAHTPSDKIVSGVMKNIDGGDIILMHDFISKDSPTPEALRILIPKLLEEGYQFVTVSELLSGN